MKRLLLLLVCMLGLAVAQSAVAQGGPIGSASVSPNPVEGKANLTFESALNENVTIVIKDLTGKTMSIIRPEMNGEPCISIPLEVESLRKGIYICQITTQSGKVKTLKFQKN
ncbi:MAG: T9SS type A sorting domain-containing protein [Flavobacteriales bacterium]